MTNVQLTPNRVLDPMLAEIVLKLTMDKPNWFFQETKGNQRYSNTMQGSVPHPDDDTYYIRSVDVMQGGRKAGVLRIERQYRHREDDRFNYVILSDRIDNGRRRNQMASTKLDVSVRNAKKYFDPPKTGELVYDALDNAKDMLGRVAYELESYVTRGAAFNSGRGIIAQKYLHAVLSGQSPDPAHESTLKATFCSTEFEDNMSKYLLAMAMRSRAHKLITIIDGDYCMFADETVYNSREEAMKAEVLCTSFDGLPEQYKDKLAVLQLMTDRELVLDVGFRLSETVFLVVENDKA